MEFITRKQYSLRSQPFMSLYGKRVVLVEPEAESCALYSRHLQGVSLDVITCGSLEDMALAIQDAEPDILVVNPTHSIDRSVNLLQRVKQKFPQLPIVTIGEPIRDNYLDAIMHAGVSFHINRRLSQPRDLLIALEHVLGA